MYRYLFWFILPLVFVPFAAGAPGNLDPSFGSGGYVLESFGGSADATSVAVQLDGKIVVFGARCDSNGTNCGVLLTRFTKDGKLDTGFGSQGLVVDGFWNLSWPQSVAVAARGKILVAGTSNTETRAAVSRYNPNGSLDRGFGQQGRVVLDLADSRFEAILVMPDGNIVLAGTADQGSHGQDVLVAMLDSSGKLIPTFGHGGMVFVNKRGNDYASSLAMDSSGRIFVGATTAKPGYGGRSSGDLLITKLLSDGKPDATFGNLGVVVQDVYYQEYDKVVTIAVTSGDIIVVAGSVLNVDHGFVVQLQPDGRRLQQFGRNGFVETNEPDFVTSFDMAVQADGNVLLCGSGHNASKTNSHGVVYRFLPNGRPDTSFHVDGIRVIGFGQASSEIRACALAGSDKLIVAGWAPHGTHSKLALARILLK